MSIILAAAGVVSPFVSDITGWLEDKHVVEQTWFDPKRQLAGRKSRYLSRGTRYLLSACGQTMSVAAPIFAAIAEEKKGVIIGTNFADYLVRQECDHLILQEGASAVNSVQAPNISVNIPAAQTAIDYRCGGVCSTLTSTATAGVEALIYAKNALDTGQVDALIVGSVEDNGADNQQDVILPQVLPGACTFAAWSSGLPSASAVDFVQPGTYQLCATHWRRYPQSGLQDVVRQKILRQSFLKAMSEVLQDKPAQLRVVWSGTQEAHPLLKDWLGTTLHEMGTEVEFLLAPSTVAPTYSGCNVQMMLLQFALLTSSKPLLFIATNAMDSVVVLYLKPHF